MRLLRIAPVFIIFFLMIQAISAQEVDVEELRQRIYDEDPQDFMNVSLGDSEVSLLLTGSWKGTLQGNLGFSNSAVGTGFASPESPLLFAQEADITLSLWLDDRWFVEASFLDDYDLNTYRAGYQGQPGEFFRYIGIGNTGLDFPSYPYLDLGGDSPSSFGYYGLMETESVKIHSLFRYDAASREEKVFAGGRERTYTYVQPQDSISGISFVLPDANIDTEIIVYIEDEKGELRDENNRRWRLASPSEYSAGKAQGIVELNIRPAGMAAVSYSNGVYNMGSYSASGFLREVQEWFDGIDLAGYPQCGNLQPIIINGTSALVIREPGTFSPFERQNRYDAASSNSEQAAVVSISSGTQINGYKLVRLAVNAASADIPLYTAAASALNIYELLPAEYVPSQRSPQSCWPLAREYPEVYLPGIRSFSGDIGLRFTNYGSAGGFIIGTDVVPGSVQVWRSGIQDSNFSYIPSSGEVVLRGAVGQNEIIRITYLKKTDETRLGSIAAGIGINYQKGFSPFSAMAAVGMRWNLTEDSAYTEEGQTSSGTVGISAKTLWDYDYLKAHIAAGFAVDQTDTTGLYRVMGMEGNETVLSLPYASSFVSNPPPPSTNYSPVLDISSRAELVYRTYSDNGVRGSTLMPLNWNAPLVSGLNRPYPVRDPLLNTASLAAEFTLDASENWTGFQVPLGYGSAVLSGAGEILIPFRLYEFAGDAGKLKIILQIGSLSGKDFYYLENTNLIWEEVLFDGSVDVLNGDLKYKTFRLDEDARKKLGNANFLRLIAVYEDVTGAVSGRVILSPPVVHGTAFRTVTLKNGNINGVPDSTVTAFETYDPALEMVYPEIIRRLHPSGSVQRVLKIEWGEMDTGVSAGIDGRTSRIPLSDYREISFFVKGPENPAVTEGTLSFIAADGPESINDPRLEAGIPMSAFTSGRWSKVTIRYQGDNTGVFVDGWGSHGTSFRYKPAGLSNDGQEGRSSYIAVIINPDDGVSLPGTTAEPAGICIDEIILEDPVMVYRINAGGAFEFRKPGMMLSAGNTEVFSDFMISTAIESEFRTAEELQTTGSMANRTGAEISVFGTKINGGIAFTAAEDTFLWSADHGISRSIGLFSFKETFYASPYDNSSRHNLNLAFSSDFYTRFNADAHYEFSSLRQRWNLGMGYKTQNVYIPSVSINSDAFWTKDGYVIEEDENYGELWINTLEKLVPDKGSGAENRRTQTQIVITEAVKPVGAILTFEGNTDFTAAINSTRSEYSAFLDIPVTLSKADINFRAGRGFKKQLDFSGEDITDDSRKFFESIGDSAPLWGVFPGYSLFSGKLNDAMDKVSPSQYTAFNDHFSARLNLHPLYTLAAFVVPARSTVRMERILEQKLDTRTDIFNLGGSLAFSAVNMFGNMGYSPVFNFYQSDEFYHTHQAAVIFSKGEDIAWRVQSTAGAGFRGFSGAVLNFVNTLTLRSGGYWLENFVTDWTYPAENSLLNVFYSWIARGMAGKSAFPGLSSLLSSDYEQLRKESLELTVDRTTDYLRWYATVGHESIIRILGRLEFTAFIKLRGSEDKYTEVFIFDVLLGTMLRVSF
jgi:hypothetical protein